MKIEVLKTMGNAIEFAIAQSIDRIPKSGTQPREDGRMHVLIINEDKQRGQKAFHDLLTSFEDCHGLEVDVTKITPIVRNSKEAKSRLEDGSYFDFVFMPEVCADGPEDALGIERPINASYFPELLRLVPTLGKKSRH